MKIKLGEGTTVLVESRATRKNSKKFKEGILKENVEVEYTNIVTEDTVVLDRLRELRASWREYERLVGPFKDDLKESMQQAEWTGDTNTYLLNDGVKVTFKKGYDRSASKRELNLDRLKADYPDLDLDKYYDIVVDVSFVKPTIAVEVIAAGVDLSVSQDDEEDSDE